MSGISAVGAQPSYTQTSEVRPPVPTSRPADGDGDHDGDRGAKPSTNGKLRVTA